MSLYVEDLWVQRGKRIVLRGVELSTEKGMVLVVLGPNGAGKTTLLEAIAGLIDPMKGRIMINGDLVFDSGPPRVSIAVEERGIGYVPQEYALFPHMTVYDNIAFGLRIRGMAERDIRIRIRELIELLGLHGLEGKFPWQLSRGQQQRVALARVLAIEPRLLLLDEPFSAMDAPTRERLRGELRNLLKSLGVTTVMVTHSFADAWLLADHVILLREGVVVASAPPSRLAEMPLRLGVAEFLGYIVLHGIVERVGNGYVLVSVEGLGPLKILAEDSVEEGIHVRVAIRPDDLVLGAKPQYKTNTYKARIIETIVTRYAVRLKLEIGDIIIVTEQARGPLVSSLGGVPKPGDTVYVHVPPSLPDIVVED